MIEFRPDRTTYIRAHAVMTAIAMGGAMLVLWLLGNPHVWTGAVAGFAAVVMRGWYMASEVLDEVWTLEGQSLNGPYQRHTTLGNIKALRSLAGSVQIVTSTGDKHLIKYQEDPQAVIDTINKARARTEQTA
ncbi:hypothetical protein [Marivita sp. GX14005]|uniref:hypothetical protein n=1 Tax=Marivita sp. GX14005 TaxID=2942276 RepID=UPI00201A0AC4|nr:hypothetical protein [Marivita sp. GX14005]MCL3881499.1 hypothetical protein [Marivita sp. GX14005]